MTLTKHFSRVAAAKKYGLVAKWDPGAEGFPREDYPHGYSGSMDIESDSVESLAKLATDIMEHFEKHSEIISRPDSIWVADNINGNIYWEY